MKKIIIILIELSICINCYSQKVPSDIQQKIYIIKSDIKLNLDSCRTNPNIGYLYSGLLMWKLLDNWRDTQKKSELYELNLQWNLVYDDDMIERMIQLLNNKYRDDELDILIKRQWQIKESRDWERITMYKMKADTSKAFKQTVDSLNTHRNRELHKDIYQDFEVFKYLKLDTTTRFYFVLDSIKKVEFEDTKKYYLSNYFFDIKSLIETCGYVNDKRLIYPLINLFNKLKEQNGELELLLIENANIEYSEDKSRWINEKTENEILIESIKFTLVRMKVEPYYSNYFKSIVLSLEKIKKQELVTIISVLSEVLHDQDSFLELSKYLHSSAYTGATGDGFYGVAYEDAYRDIKKYLGNKELWDIINKSDFNLEKDRFEIYDWMQKNYGKYEIKRIW